MGDTFPEIEAETPGDTRTMRGHWSTVCADTLAEVEAETLGNTWGAAQPPVDAVAASQAEVDVETPCDTVSDATQWTRRWLQR